MSGLAPLDQNPTRKLPTHRFVRERRHSDTGSFSDPACGSRRRPDPVGARIVPTQRIAIQWAPNDILKSATDSVCSLSPLFAAELGFTRARSLNDWPKSDKSDFG